MKAFPKRNPHRSQPASQPVQNARCNVPVICREQIQEMFQQLVELEVITPVTQPTECISSPTYPYKPNSILCICLDPLDLNKASIQEEYKAPTIDEISYRLNSTTTLSKLDSKDDFWSIQLNELSSYLTIFNTHKIRYQFLHMLF